MKASEEFLLKIFLSCIPFLWALFCVLLNFSRISFLSQYHQSFPVVFIVIFYFAVFSPQKLNIYAVFFLGVLADFLSLAPMGLHTFVFCFMFFISNLIRTYIHSLPFFKLWGVFSILFFLSDIIWSWLFRMVSGIWVSASFWFVQYIITCLLYPLFIWITGYLMKKIRMFA